MGSNELEPRKYLRYKNLIVIGLQIKTTAKYNFFLHLPKIYSQKK